MESGGSTALSSPGHCLENVQICFLKTEEKSMQALISYENDLHIISKLNLYVSAVKQHLHKA
ncbi:MAG: hypothetical protein US62_C0030G0002 [Candidatus Woesebacteria bacterium GW2011_GWA1_37_8]|nr:MAG: hypothetical protein US62_C0030G0002 [Candidatus Woesebacteria bacterium GW2011_GWA1_37_8]